LTPELWTRITFFLDSPYFSAAFVAAVLARSHNLILEKVTFRRKIWTAMNDEHERARVVMARQVIASHLHRCRAIVFNVRFSSSLPSFPSDFHGNAKHLKSLTLRCLEDDGAAISSVNETSLSPVHREPFQCPNLRILAIDGRNYFNACLQNVNLSEMLPAISALSISRFTPVAIRSESFTPFALAHSLIPFQCLTFLSIDDIHLDDSPTPVLDDDDDGFHYIDYPPETMVFKNVYNPHCVSQIVEVLGEPENMHLTRCRPGHLFDDERTVTLSLNDIDVGDDLVKFLDNCNSPKIIINGCPGFGDEVLDALTTGIPITDLGRICCARSVEDLSILNCVDSSISKLKQLVETRCIPRDPDDVHRPLPIKVLRLSGRVPDVSLEDKEWFEGRLSEFFYNPTP